MSHSIWVFAALMLACAALAAPAPEPFVKGWSNPVDLDKDCKIRREPGALIIEMPGSDHDYDAIRRRFNAPRLLRDIEGDFEIQVRVQIDCRPSDQSTVKGQPSCVSAGFLLIYPETSRAICDRFEFGISQPGICLDGYAVKPLLAAKQIEAQSRKGIGEDGYAAMKGWNTRKQKLDMTWDRAFPDLGHMIWDRGWHLWSLPKKSNYAYLRLELQKRSFMFFISANRDKWTRVVRLTGPPTKLKLGLAAYSTSSEPSKVRFDQLKITRGKEKSK